MEIRINTLAIDSTLLGGRPRESFAEALRLAITRRLDGGTPPPGANVIELVADRVVVEVSLRSGGME